MYQPILATIQKMPEKLQKKTITAVTNSLADYAEELTTETSEVPEHLAFYIDQHKENVCKLQLDERGVMIKIEVNMVGRGLIGEATKALSLIHI